MTELNKDLRTLYFPTFNFRADVDQLCLDYATRVALSIPRTIKLPVVESEFDDIFKNSLKIKQTTVAEEQYIINKLNPGAKITLQNKQGTTRSKSRCLIQFTPPTEDWYELFNSFCNLRVSNKYMFRSDNIQAVTVGRANHEVINNSLNRGGCGLTALVALGILTFDDYRFAFSCAQITDRDIGINTSTLITLLSNNLPGINIRSFICAQEFLMNNDNDYDGFLAMENYLRGKLFEGCATLLRFGNESNGILDETEFGHTIIVYKSEGRLYFFDAWTATLLTFKQKNTSKPEVNSLYATPGFFSYDEFNLRKIARVMAYVDHTERTIFQLFELNGTANRSFDSPFHRNTESAVISILRTRVTRSPNVVSGIAAAKWHAAAVARRSLTLASPSSTSLTAQVGQIATTLRTTLRSIKFNIFSIETNAFELTLCGVFIFVVCKILNFGGNKTRKNRSKNKTRKNKNRNRKNKNKNKTRKYKR